MSFDVDISPKVFILFSRRVACSSVLTGLTDTSVNHRLTVFALYVKANAWVFHVRLSAFTLITFRMLTLKPSEQLHLYPSVWSASQLPWFRQGPDMHGLHFASIAVSTSPAHTDTHSHSHINIIKMSLSVSLSEQRLVEELCWGVKDKHFVTQRLLFKQSIFCLDCVFGLY